MKTQTLTFLFVLGCISLVLANTPTTNSEPTCFIAPVIDIASITCDDMGTPYDNSDDIYTFNVNITSFNDEASSTGTFADDQGNTFNYADSPSSMTYGPFAIADGDITIIYADEGDPECGGSLIVSNPNCPIAECEVLPDAATNILCDDNGTPFDASDDTFTFDITVNGSNTEATASNTFNDDQGNTGIAYGTTQSYGPFPIADGDVVVTFTDADSPDCTGMMMATPPATCSEAMCMITPEILGVFCNDNGTDDDRSDDVFTFSIMVSGGSASGTLGDDLGNTGIAYGTQINYGPYPISGGSITINYTDTDLAECTAPITVIPPPTCSLDAEVPTMGEWGLIILGLLMSITAITGIRSRSKNTVYS